MTERIVIVGSSGAGKTTLARRIERRFGHARLELDALHHGPSWEARPESQVRSAIEAFVAREERWVIDGNYAMHREAIWPAADSVVWLDLPRRRIIPALYWRTLRRVLMRTELWNGNREPLRNLWSLDPDRSVVAWSIANHARYRAEFLALMAGDPYPHLRWARLSSRREVDAYVAKLHTTREPSAPSEVHP